MQLGEEGVFINHCQLIKQSLINLFANMFISQIAGLISRSCHTLSGFYVP